MYSPSLSGGAANSESGSRIFVYEVEGMRQSQATDQTSNPIRRSGSVFISVPYDRMNQEMRRIARMGGKIVSIRPSNSAPETTNGKVAPEARKKFRFLLTSTSLPIPILVSAFLQKN